MHGVSRRYPLSFHLPTLRLTGYRSHLKPGGWIEHSEINPDTKSDDGTTGKGDPFYDAGEFAHGCTEMNGKSLVIQADLKQMIMDAGFVNVVEHYYKWPIGDWPADPRLKELGIINARHWLEGIEGWTMRLMTTLYGVRSSDSDKGHISDQGSQWTANIITFSGLQNN